ncbi:XTP/dITP diphosphatase [Paenalkalicoccus suaedae]|uniref:dITP/XTP pyrophosphatase n=1 Tax=Paenalkalicoccus suaedae TaxID=2592382 RepID=A0A859FIE0_9BACI|nr:XTP/dITP diphosphatase [Paenalkalicoccus suaedae]QKS71966.1 XTP/dITP diphosphatase [Paenalkalicoccus suaedae]
MFKEIFIASNNAGKIKEFRHFFAKKGVEVKSLADLPEEIDVVEDGDTFEANAIKKAKEIGERFNIAVLSDDSGLEVDALDGAPGIYSARYAGEAKSDDANNAKLLDELADVKEGARSARFVCALAIYHPDKGVKTVRGTVEGEIGFEKHGDDGFGYDPLFYVPTEGKFMAELGRERKNEISHRANALHLLDQEWDKWF